MNGIKIGFKMTDLAKALGANLESIPLKDGSSLNVLTKTNTCDFFHVNGDELLGAKGFRGKDASAEGAKYRTVIAEKLGQKLDEIV